MLYSTHPLDIELEVEIAISDPLDVGVKAKIGCGGGRDDEESDEGVRVLGDVRESASGYVLVALTSNQSKGAKTKGAARHNNQIVNVILYTVTPKEKVRRGSLCMMWWRHRDPNALALFCKP